MNQFQFEIRDMRHKAKFELDDQFLNGYARFLEIYAVGVYNSLCRHAEKKQQICWPSIEKISEELSIGRNSVIEAMKRLEFWQIIKKERIGKKLNNRYVLLDKSQWVSITKENLKCYSEVLSVNFTSLLRKLHEFTTGTSIVRSTHSKDNTHIKGKMKKIFIPGYGSVLEENN